MLRNLKHKAQRFLKDRAGSASVEFVLIAPVYFAIMLSTFEAGWLMTKSMMLERGLDLTIRDLRLGLYPNLDHDAFKKRICDNSKILKDCENTMLLELVPVNKAADVPTSTVCRDRSSTVVPTVAFNPATADREIETMFVRACVIVDPMVPGMGLALHLPLDTTGGLALVSYGAFVNEPN